MTLITDALDRAARQCSVVPPSSWASETGATYMEIKDFLDETANDILDRVDLASPIAASTTLSTDGSENYSLPSNFRRLQRNDYAVFETTTQRNPLIPVTTDGHWQYIKDVGTSGAYRYYRLKGFAGNWTIDIYDNPSASITINVNYITDNWMENVSGTDGSAFTANDDVLLLPRRIVEAGIVWRWRERKGLPYVDKYNDYEAQLARLSNDRRSRQAIDFSGDGGMRSALEVPVPDFIPAS